MRIIYNYLISYFVDIRQLRNEIYKTNQLQYREQLILLGF